MTYAQRTNPARVKLRDYLLGDAHFFRLKAFRTFFHDK